MSGMMRSPVAVGLVGVLVAGAAGCITSPVWEHGATRAAREARLGPCPGGLLEDGEDGNNQILKTGGRDGYWFTFKDAWGSTLEPAGEFKMSPSDRQGSRFAAQIHGRVAPSGESLYVGMGFSFVNPRLPFDVSQSQGVRFWGKGPGKVRFKAPDANTAPEGDRCTDCYNDFGVDLYFQDEWVRYTVPFDKMTQQPGWGDRAPKLSTREVFGLAWQFTTPGAEYDLWVDEIELVGCAEPTP